MLLHLEFEHDFAYYDACADSYSEGGEYYENISSEFLAPKYGLEL